MKDETYYRMLATAGFPCPHCEKLIEIFSILSEAYLFSDGKLFRGRCPHCSERVPMMDYRDYGVKRPIWEMMTMVGAPVTDKRHWSETGRDHPLWAIPNNLG